MGDEATVPLLRKCFESKTPLGQTLHRKIMNDFRQYALVGGMPQSILAYQNGKDFGASDEAKRRILRLYRDDVSKFAAGYEEKVYAVFDGIPGQLSKKEKKYALSSIHKNARFRAYKDSFIWLSEAMIVSTCYNATDPGWLSARITPHRNVTWQIPACLSRILLWTLLSPTMNCTRRFSLTGLISMKV